MSYDHLGKLVLVSMLGGVLCVPVVTVPIVLLALFHFASLLVEKDDASIKDFFRGIRLYWARGLFFGLLVLLVYVVLVSNIVFYLRLLKGDYAWIGAVLGGLSVWGLVLYSLMLLYAGPLALIKKHNIFGVLKYAFLLTVDNVVYTIGVAILLVAMLFVLLALTHGVGLFFLGSFCIVLPSVAHHELARYYEKVELETAAVESGQHLKRLTAEDEFDRYANRGFRDIVKPWEM